MSGNARKPPSFDETPGFAWVEQAVKNGIWDVLEKCAERINEAKELEADMLELTMTLNAEKEKIDLLKYENDKLKRELEALKSDSKKENYELKHEENLLQMVDELEKENEEVRSILVSKEKAERLAEPTPSLLTELNPDFYEDTKVVDKMLDRNKQ
ncbi:unnamed protein product, partial [Mesorhabditis spiculigera]